MSPGASPASCPPDGVVVRSDAEARAVVTAARRAGDARPVLGLLGGDLCRAVGGTGDEARLRDGRGTVLPVDLGAVLVDGRLHWFVAHLVARRGWWRGPHRRRHERAAPRVVGRGPAGPPERRPASTCSTRDLPLGERWKARRRLRHRHPRAPPRDQRAARRRRCRSTWRRDARSGSTASRWARPAAWPIRVEPDALRCVV